LLFAVLGLFILCSSNDLITTYLAIELQSLSFYILTAFKKDSPYSVGSGLKYLMSSQIYNKDVPSFWLAGFQDPASISMEGILIFNKHLTFLLIVIVLFVVWFLVLTVWPLVIHENSPVSSVFFFATVLKISIFVVTLRFSYCFLFADLSWSMCSGLCMGFLFRLFLQCIIKTCLFVKTSFFYRFKKLTNGNFKDHRSLLIFWCIMLIPTESTLVILEGNNQDKDPTNPFLDNYINMIMVTALCCWWALQVRNATKMLKFPAKTGNRFKDINLLIVYFKKLWVEIWRPHIPDQEDIYIWEAFRVCAFLWIIYFIRHVDVLLSIFYRYKHLFENASNGFSNFSSLREMIDTHLVDFWGIALVGLLWFVLEYVLPEIEPKPQSSFNPRIVLKSWYRYLIQVFSICYDLLETEYREVLYCFIILIGLTLGWGFAQLGLSNFFE
jgi:Cytochrome C oxidase subunit II, transmembrane domain/Proton-conducting membrane transporter